MILNLPDQHHLRSAQGYLALGMWIEANTELELISPHFRTLPEVLRLRVVIYHATKNWELLQVVARKLSQHEPQNIQWVISHGYATRRAESIEAAKAVLLQAHDRFRDEPLIHYNHACYHCVMGDLVKAREYLSETFAIDPEWRLRALEDEDLEPLWSSF